MYFTADAEMHFKRLSLYVLQDESGYRWPRDDHPMNRQTEYRYYIKLHSNAMHRKVWSLSVPTTYSKQLLLQQKD